VPFGWLRELRASHLCVVCDLKINGQPEKIAGQKGLPCFMVTPSLHSGGSMKRKLVTILGALGVSIATLSGCVDDGGYSYYEARAPIIYREQVVVERRAYYVGQGARYYHRGSPNRSTFKQETAEALDASGQIATSVRPTGKIRITSYPTALSASVTP
jgi:hypothetical protein